MNIKQFISTKAFIVHRNKVLILRVSESYSEGIGVGKYEMPGGRVEPGERFNEGLLRELKEETGLSSIVIGEPFHVDEYHPVVRNDQWQVVAIFFKCSTDTDKVVLSKDHDSYEWIDPRDYNNYALKPVSKNAFVEFLKNFKFE